MNHQKPPYEETSFWRKIRRWGMKAGRNVIEKALILYFCMQDRDTPRWAKGVIMGALAYFVWPLDTVPDWLPGIGLVDDLGVLATALTTILMHVKPDHRDRAQELLEWRWASDQTSSRGKDRKTGDGADRPTPPMDPKSRYAAILGVEPDSDDETIRAHYRDRVKKYHPDRVQHLGPEFQAMAEQKLKDINEAYEYFRSKSPGL